VAGTLLASRSTRTKIDLSFVMPGNEGLSGRVSSYEIRYKVCALGASCTISGADFSSATILPNLPAITDGGTPMVVSAENIPLDATIAFALRATNSTNVESTLATAVVSTGFGTLNIAGLAAEADFGVALTSAFLKGGAKPDLIIGRAGLSSNKGGVRFVYGDGNPATEISAAQVGLGATASARLGRAVATLGDLDRDGYEDVLVAAPLVANATCTAGGASTGKVFLFFGGPNGLRSGASPVSCASVGATEDCYVQIDPPTATAICGFGQSVSGIGRFDAGTDGSRPMFAVGAGDLTASSSNIGKVFVYRVNGDRPNITVELVATISGGIDDYHFGSSVCGVGDVNGDGIADMLIGASRRGQASPVAGRAYLILGHSRFSGAGLQESIVAGGSSPTDGVISFGNLIAADFFGSSCSKAGDMDGDGRNDFVISAPGSQHVYVIRGRSDLDARPSMSSPDVIAVTHANWAQPGEVSAGYDVDGDGLADLVVGDMNAVYVFRGSAAQGVTPAPFYVFNQPAPIVSTGFPVLLMPNFVDAQFGEQAIPDIAIGKVAGPLVTVRY
jgi:hypothetical protein